VTWSWMIPKIPASSAPIRAIFATAISSGFEVEGTISDFTSAV